MSNLGSLFVPEVQLFDNAGAVLAGGKLQFYAAGTTTPQNTYSDAALTTPNANPVVLDSAGRALIYLDNLAYKVVAKNSADVTLWTVDNIYPPGYIATQTVLPALPTLCQGRLTLTSGAPVTTADVTAATSVFFTPYKGNGIALYDGTKWTAYTFTEKTLSLTGLAANTVFDVWGRLSAGALVLDTTAWTNDTTRATALAVQDGVYVRTGDTTRRYLGTFRTTGTIGQTEDSLAKRYVWNYYNRVIRALRVNESTGTWTYTTAAFRQANAAAGNQIDLVIGVAEVPVNVLVQGLGQNSSTGVNFSVGIGEDATNAAVSGSEMQFGVSHSANNAQPTTARLLKYPTAGRHFYAWLEYSVNVGTTTFTGTAGVVYAQTGITGTIEG